MHLSLSMSLSLSLSFFVRSCLIITLIQCRQACSCQILRRAVFVKLNQNDYKYWGGNAVESNVSKVKSLWGHFVMLWRLWLFVVTDQPRDQARDKVTYWAVVGQLKKYTIAIQPAGENKKSGKKTIK